MLLSVCSQHLSLVVRYLDFYLVYVVFKVPLFPGVVWKNHAPVTVLDSADPFALVAAAVSPVHLAIAISLVVLVLAFINVATSPLELTKPAFMVVDIVALVAI